MPESYIQLPADSSGKKLHTRQRTVGADTVQDQYSIPISARVEAGTYLGHPGALTVQASAHGATAGFWWLINPVGSAVIVALRRVDFMSQLGSALVAVTSPRVTLERMTFTGTSSGGTVTIAKGQTSDATNVGLLLTATTGLTPAAVAAFAAFLPTASATAVGYAAPAALSWNPVEDEQLILAAGEGVVCRQADAGTASDTRRIAMSLVWQEYSLP